MATSLPEKACSQSRSAGLTFGYGGQGLIYEHNIDSRNFADFQIRTETVQTFSSNRSNPGISASAGWNVIFAELSSRSGNKISFHAGPGISVGFADGRMAPAGLILGLRGRVGSECIFDRNLALSLSISPLIAGHLRIEDGMLNMRPYQNGLLNAIMPEVSLKYSFVSPEYSVPKNTSDRRRFNIGLEWGYIASFYQGHHYDFFAPEGYRVDDRGRGISLHSNAEVYANIGYHLTDKWNIGLYIGYEGIGNIHRAVPVSLRATRYFSKDSLSDTWFTFLDLGSGLSIKNPAQEIYTGKIGGGYRMVLSGSANLDFILSLRTVVTHPQVDYDGTAIEMEKTNSNIGYLSSASFGIAISFN
jgi:hypothetical protein